MFSKQSFRVFTGISSFQFLAMFRRGLFYTYLSIYLRAFLKLSVWQTTLYATLPMIMSVIFQTFVWGPLSDKLQKRRFFIVLGEILAGIGTILVWFIHSIFTDLFVAGFVIIIGLSCIEIFWSMSNIGWSALISDLYPLKKRSKIMGELTSIGGLGRIIGISIGGYLYDNGFGFRNGLLFFIASIIMFLSTIPMFFTPEGGIKISREPILEEHDSRSNHINYKTIFIIFIVALVFVNFGRNSIATIYSQYLILDNGFHVDSILLSYIANTQSVAVLIIGVSIGRLSKIFGDSKTFILGILFAILALLITGLTPELYLIFISSFLIGTAEVIISASSYTIASNLIPPKIRGKLFGVYNTTFFLSWGLACTLISGPLIDFLIIQGTNEVVAYQAAFIIGALITSIGLLIYLILEIWLHFRKKKKDL